MKVVRPSFRKPARRPTRGAHPPVLMSGLGARGPRRERHWSHSPRVLAALAGIIIVGLLWQEVYYARPPQRDSLSWSAAEDEWTTPHGFTAPQVAYDDDAPAPQPAKQQRPKRHRRKRRRAPSPPTPPPPPEGADSSTYDAEEASQVEATGDGDSASAAGASAAAESGVADAAAQSGGGDAAGESGVGDAAGESGGPDADAEMPAASNRTWCLAMAAAHAVVPRRSWGSLSSDGQQRWASEGCDDVVAAAGSAGATGVSGRGGATSLLGSRRRRRRRARAASSDAAAHSEGSSSSAGSASDGGAPAECARLRTEHDVRPGISWGSLTLRGQVSVPGVPSSLLCA